MSWLFSQVLVEEYLGENFSDGEQSVPLNGNNIPQAYCAPDKMTGFSRLSRFGMTYKPLTETRGEELLTLYLAAFHAKTSHQRGGGLALMENEAECGEKWRGSFTKYDPDSCSWKTHQCSLLGDLEEFLETWPQWGLMRDGECWEQQMLAQTIRGTEFGLSERWPTPKAIDGIVCHSQKMMEKKFYGKGDVDLTIAVKMNKWPTPTVMDSISRSKESWEKAQFRPKQGKNLIKLGDIQHWPTPTTRDYKGANSLETTNKKIEEGLRAHLGQLPNAVQHTEQKPIGGTLNPMWVEWLMGWPLGWTDLKPLEMDKSLSVQQQPGES
jgi:hypothetical protein